MISHPSTGVQQWANQPHVLSGVHGGVVQSKNRPSNVIDLTGCDSRPPENEHPVKRPRLELNAGGTAAVDSKTLVRSAELRSASGNGTFRPPVLSVRGRPPCSFHDLVAETSGGGALQGGNPAVVSQVLKTASPPPFPIRPWKGALPERPVSGSQESSPEREVLTTPYHPEIPSVAPVLKGDRVADFSLWTGDHPEDVLNEQTTKQGHYDRTQVSQNESNTARPSLYAQLKHRAGLQVLSSVFAAALEKRQLHIKVTTSSTFRPPPRVTLTDNKREAWLRDLANPNVPLRRLSRTIPHGIRGKMLLDQCLSKWIPIGRAVWLAKCVGANEIRAFKRKGTSGALALGLEAKWVRDWTTNVQLFIESVISVCGKSVDWRNRMTYGVRLMARLFFENLLDQDCYLEWFLSSLENATADTLPIWLLMLGIYWDHILRYRKRGRRLAEVLLEKLRQLTASAPKELMSPLIGRISYLVKRLAYEQPSSFVLPRSWHDYNGILSACLNLDEPADKVAFQSLMDRNLRVQPVKDCHKERQRLPQQRIISVLDAACSSHNLTALSETCLSTVEDRAVLISRLLEWAATFFRHGLVRVYIAVRLLRKWKKLGIDVDSHTLSFLVGAGDKTGLDMVNVYHVIAELVRSQTFCVTRYLEWLVARGAVGSYERTKQQSVTNDVELLSQLPVSRLPQHVQNLRNTLLIRAGLPLEDSVLKAVKADIRQRLPGVFGPYMEHNTVTSDNVHRYPNLTWAIKSEVGQWIRRGVADHYKETPRSIVTQKFASGAQEKENSSLTPEEFVVIRGILESLGDLSILADVLSHAADSNDTVVLASAVDTLNYHFDAFNVIGAITDLFRSLFGAYVRVKHAGLPVHDLVFSLIDLGLRVPNEANTLTILRQDLARLDRKSVLAASSPVSEHMAETLNSANPSFSDDLDQFLSSGNTMDEVTLIAIFKSLTSQLESGSGKRRLSSNEICRYLSQLRTFNHKQFDLLLIKWIEGFLKSSTRSNLLPKVLPPLVGVGCVTLPAFFAMVKRLQQAESRPRTSNVAGLQLNLVELLVPSSLSSLGAADLLSYRFRMAQQEFLSKYPEEALSIVHDASASFCLSASQKRLASQKPLLHRVLIPVLRDLLVRHPEPMVDHCLHQLKENHSATIDAIQQTLNLLLELPGSDGTLVEAEGAINKVNDFSLPFCQLKLQLLFDTASQEDVKDGVVDIMLKAAVADVRAGKSHWLDLVSLPNQDAVQQIRHRAEKGFLSIVLTDGPVECDTLTTIDRSHSQDTAKIYLTVMDGLASSIPQVGMPSVAPLLVEKMNVLLQKLVLAQANLKSVNLNRGGVVTDHISRILPVFERNFNFWFTALLHMIVIHRPAFDSAQQAVQRSSALLDQSRLLIAICCLALSRSPASLASQSSAVGYVPSYMSAGQQQLCTYSSLQTYALDVAASLVDSLPDDARQQCSRFLRDRFPPQLHVQNEPRLLYLLGPISDSTLPISTSSPTTAAPSSSMASANLLPGTSPIQTTAPINTPAGISEDATLITNRLRIQHRGRAVSAFTLRPWEMLEEAAPMVGMNDTAVDLGFFGARRVRE